MSRLSGTRAFEGNGASPSFADSAAAITVRAAGKKPKMAVDTYVPAMEDLMGLYQLCGSEEKVVDYLARLNGIPNEAIAPIVHSWIQALPKLPLPSRQRSAPPALNPPYASVAAAVAKAMASSSGAPAAAAVSHGKRQQLQHELPPQVMKIIPPNSAPARGSNSVVAAFRALDSRLNNNTRAQLGHAPPRAAAQQPGNLNLFPSAVGGKPQMRMLPPPPVPEDEEVQQWNGQRLMLNGGEPREVLKPDVMGTVGNQRGVGAPLEDAALKAYLERNALVNGWGRLAPTHGGARGKEMLPSTWMTRRK